MKKSIFLFLLASLSLTTSAQNPVKVGDCWYTIEDNHFTAIVVENPTGGGYSGEVVIPETINYGGNTYTVSEIGYRAFCGTEILKVTINGKLDDKGRGLRIGTHAFSYCKSLSSVTIGDGVDQIQYCAFYACDNLVTMVVGDDVVDIYNQAFQNCPSLTTVILGSSVKSIGASAFFGCEKLKDVYCYGELSPSASPAVFEDNQFEKITLHVPGAYYNNYYFNDGSDNYPWQHFVKSEKMNNTTFEKCATPKISYVGGNVSFTCDTPDVAFNSTVEYVENSFNNASEFPAPSHFRVRVVAVKDGFLPSDVAEQEFALSGIVDSKTGEYKGGDVNRDGNVNSSDREKLTNLIMGE